MSPELEELYDWLENQDYWIRKDKVEEKFPDIEFRESSGITLKKDDEGNLLIPRRDLRMLAKPKNSSESDDGGSTGST